MKRLLLQSSLLSICLGWLGAMTAGAQEDFSAELPRIAATEPEAALETFVVADGFEIQQVAAEPLISSPVAMEWDAEGRLYVCAMRGYSEDRDAGISRITRLQDDDHDGVYDRSSIYADGLLWPTAVFPFDGGLFVADAPHIYYFQDHDGDGAAEEKKIVLTGFGVSNVQGLLNSFRWGLDNRIHVACGTVGGRVHRATDDPQTAVEVRGRDLAFDPRSYEFVLTSGGGQHGMSFDDWGRKFVSSNSDHIQQVMYEDRYIARNPHLKAPSARLSIAADGRQAEVFRSSPVEPWRVVRTRLRVSGAVGGPVEGGGRAAGYFTGATGITLYRGDAWPPQWQGLAIVGDVGSNLIHRKRLSSEGLPFSAHRIDENSEFVTSRDIWFRPAQFANAPDGSLHVIDVCREVIEHPHSLPAEIKQHLDLTAGRDRGRIYRIVPTGFQHRLTPSIRNADTDQLVKLLEHPNAWHRETAARRLFERQDTSAAADLAALAASSNLPQGRLHALYALAGLDALDEHVLLMAVRDEHPQVRRHAVRLSEPLLASEPLRTAVLQRVQDESIEVRYQTAFSLGFLSSEMRTPALAELLRRDGSDSWMRMAVLSSAADQADQLFIELVRDPDDQALAMMNLLGDRLQNQASSNAELRKALDRLLEHLRQVALDEQEPLADRVDAIAGLRYGNFAAVRDELEALLDYQQPAALQRQALATLGQFSDDAVAPLVLSVWPSLSPPLREVAIEVLFSRPDRTAAVFDAVDAQQIAVGEIPKTRLQLVADGKQEALRARAAAYLDQKSSASRAAIVSNYQSSLQLSADHQRGRQVFVKHCASCHAADGVGHEIGPKLATLQARGAEAILTNVLDPNREVNPQYLNYVVLTDDGRTLTGMIAAESATSVTLRRADLASDTILRSQIEQLRSTGVSLMPEGLEESIDPQAMADLIGYVLQLK